MSIAKDTGLEKYKREASMALDPEKILFWSVYQGELAPLETALNGTEYGPDHADENGSSFLHFAVQGGHIHIVKFLLDKGADIEKKTRTGSIALHRASREGQIELVKLLLDKGANINAQNKDEESSLHIAVFYKRYEVVDLLLERGADKTLKNFENKSALDLAEQIDDKRLIQILK